MDYHLSETGPVAALFLCPPVQPLEDQLAGMPAEFSQHPAIAADPVIVVVALQLLFQFGEQFSCSQFTAITFDPGFYRR